ncbi:membrane protein [Catellatospora methionotrophica]|uniref:Membrane protein n=1 Tax=Catellatospora methionotrophica TaxID=121620 RepID=A0A8J3PJ62_9ACTN|nr:DedA family protein [Catellatospora methionotrophica]GIG17081.1 membrane protein [Catellatospora methionotrophica]
MEFVGAWLETLPALAIYLIVGLVIGTESMGIPLPGEIVLVSASLLAATQDHISPWGVAAAAAIGAIVGDSIGYAVGKRGGRPLLDRLGRRFPKHLGPEQIVRAEAMFGRWGTWAVFFGRFIALLRILAGPMAGALKVPYRKFLLANAGGGLVWAFGTTFAIYALGAVAEAWLKRFSWAALALAVVFGLGTTWLFKHRAKKSLAAAAADETVAVLGADEVDHPTDGATDAKKPSVQERVG